MLRSDFRRAFMIQNHLQDLPTDPKGDAHRTLKRLEITRDTMIRLIGESPLVSPLINSF